MEHLKALLFWADHRGSDVQLRAGLVLDGSTQDALCPAFAWRWSAVQEYHWWAAQRINCAGSDGASEQPAYAYRYRHSARHGFPYSERQVAAAVGERERFPCSQ